MDVNVDAGICYGTEHQLRLAQIMGGTPNWTFEYPSQLILAGRNRIVCASHVLGTVHEQLWTWGWADPNLPRRASTVSQAVRAYGQAHQIDAYTNATVPLQGRLTAAALSAASKAVHHNWVSYTLYPRPGWAVYLTLTHDLLQLPPATSTTVVETVLASASAIDCPATALRWYAHWRGLTFHDHGDRLLLAGIGGDDNAESVEITVDGNTITALQVHSQEESRPA